MSTNFRAGLAKHVQLVFSGTRLVSHILNSGHGLRAGEKREKKRGRNLQNYAVDLGALYF